MRQLLATGAALAAVHTLPLSATAGALGALCLAGCVHIARSLRRGGMTR
jgi:hypothetical protein